MPPQQRGLKLETTWIREYARTYRPSEGGFSFCAQDLREAGLSLVALRQVLRHGYVVLADKLDGPGAVWIVEGKDNEENQYRLTIKVISEELDVTLRKVERLGVIETIEKIEKIEAIKTPKEAS